MKTALSVRQRRGLKDGGTKDWPGRQTILFFDYDHYRGKTTKTAERGARCSRISTTSLHDYDNCLLGQVHWTVEESVVVWPPRRNECIVFPLGSGSVEAAAVCQTSTIKSAFWATRQFCD